MIVEAPPLTHRFTALYADGSTFVQPMDDASTTRKGGSAFTDVDVARVKCFFLEGADHLYMVDLEDGHFEIDGVSFRMGPEDVEGPLRLVYFRRVAHSKTSGIKSGELLSRSVRRHYHLGWEANGIQRTIAVGFEIFHG